MTERPNVILLTIDALRGDHVGYRGYDRDTTPFLDSLAENVVRIDTAISASSHTRETVPALLSGEYPDIFAENGYRHSTKTIADRLSKVGYQTPGFHSNPYLSRAYGFDQGFDEFYDDLLLGQKKLFALAQPAIEKFVVKQGENYARAPEINNRSLDWIDTVDDEPMVLWTHYMDVHGPYYPLAGFTNADRKISNIESYDLYQKCIKRPEDVTKEERGLLVDKYDGEIQYLDAELEAFFDGLEAKDLLSESLDIVTADQGNAFGEHGYFTHPRDLHDYLLHVQLPGSEPGDDSKRIETPVSTLDIAPTFLDFARMEHEELPQRPLLDEEGDVVRVRPEVAFSSATEEDADEAIRCFAGRTETRKMVIDREIEDGSIRNEQGFDLNSDSDEQKPVGEFDEEYIKLRLRVYSLSIDQPGAVNVDVQSLYWQPQIRRQTRDAGVQAITNA